MYVLASLMPALPKSTRHLPRQFPDYSALAKGEALSVAATQSLLGADEVLLVFLGGEQSKPAPFETFLWAISKTDSRWVKIDGGIDRITRQVQELRCGLDDAAWQREGISKCANLVGKKNESPSGGGACHSTLCAHMNCTARCSAKSVILSGANGCLLCRRVH